MVGTGCGLRIAGPGDERGVYHAVPIRNNQAHLVPPRAWLYVLSGPMQNLPSLFHVAQLLAEVVVIREWQARFASVISDIVSGMRCQQEDVHQKSCPAPTVGAAGSGAAIRSCDPATPRPGFSIGIQSSLAFTLSASPCGSFLANQLHLTPLYRHALFTVRFPFPLSRLGLWGLSHLPTMSFWTQSIPAVSRRTPENHSRSDGSLGESLQRKGAAARSWIVVPRAAPQDAGGVAFILNALRVAVLVQAPFPHVAAQVCDAVGRVRPWGYMPTALVFCK